MAVALLALAIRYLTKSSSINARILSLCRTLSVQFLKHLFNAVHIYHFSGGALSFGASGHWLPKNISRASSLVLPCGSSVSEWEEDPGSRWCLEQQVIVRTSFFCECSHAFGGATLNVLLKLHGRAGYDDPTCNPSTQEE